MEEKCKGLFFKLKMNNYDVREKSRMRFEFKNTFLLMRRKSCKGCDDCLYLLDLLYGYMENCYNLEFCGLKVEGEKKHNAVFKLQYDKFDSLKFTRVDLLT